ncbi:hypothetical protein D3C73_828520 [compost metagenome]
MSAGKVEVVVAISQALVFVLQRGLNIDVAAAQQVLPYIKVRGLRAAVGLQHGKFAAQFIAHVGRTHADAGRPRANGKLVVQLVIALFAVAGKQARVQLVTQGQGAVDAGGHAQAVFACVGAAKVVGVDAAGDPGAGFGVDNKVGCARLGARPQRTGRDHAGQVVQQQQRLVQATAVYRITRKQGFEHVRQHAIARARCVIQQDLAVRPFHDADANQAALDFLGRQIRACQQVAVMPIVFGEPLRGGAQAVQVLLRPKQIGQQGLECGLVVCVVAVQQEAVDQDPAVFGRILFRGVRGGALGGDIQRRRL